MCGIAGIQGGHVADLVPRMTAALAHRGPDGEGIVELADGVTALGHRRLSIIDLSQCGCQPMTARPDRGGGQQTGLTLVYNGEIYNYRALRSELERAGHEFHSATDSEVILHLYEQEGLGMLERLNGIYALAIHDARPHGRPAGVPQGALVIARDPLGVKPLYYAATAAGFAFASEIKALLHLPGLSREIDPVAIHQMLAYLWTPAPRTALASVRKLEPGNAMVVHDGAIVRRWTFYQLTYPEQPNAGSFEETASALAEHVYAAVERQLMSDVPVGAFLSGGLDSSAVVAMMRRAMPNRRFPCFTIGFADSQKIEGSANDLPYARRVAQHLDVDLHEITLDPDAIHRIHEIVWWLDEPQGDPAPINALLIAEKARELGVPVLLSGAGGDDVFGGYRRHWALQFERTWAWLPQLVRKPLAVTARALAGGALPGQNNTAVRRAVKMFTAADASADRRLVSYFYWTPETSRRALYTEGFRERLGDVDTAAPLLASLQQLPPFSDRLQQMLYLEARHFLADHNLNYTDRTGMATGVEVRVPLLDLELVQFAAGIPSAYKQRGRMGKAIFKKAMEPYLPADVIYRPKTGFGAPLRRWLHRELASLVDDTLGRESLAARGIFEPAAVQRLVALDRAGRVDGSYLIYAVMTLELWCRRFVD
jgi:asparagine synthase (glutamine-hydrolysing)